ncbi:MAG: response regulator [Deltaproteobacteria bacterium]|jgi:CheY-like chemotaxis protein|nr:response regulator [Deltaproteobacteria bacterium]MBW2537446.1 response regulator [Deltaproteobacteria bacterium]
MNDDQAAREPESRLPLEGYRILVVDDEADVRVYLSTVLEDAGATVLEAEDGDEGLEMAQREHPDLVTLDLSMPGKDGVETFGALRHAEETRETPVCIITGHAEYRQLIYQRSDRAPEGFMSKPIDEKTLVGTVRRILELKHRKAAREG